MNPTFRTYAKVAAAVICADLFIWAFGSLLKELI